MSCATCGGTIIRRFVGAIETWRHLREPADGHAAKPSAVKR